MKRILLFATMIGMFVGLNAKCGSGHDQLVNKTNVGIYVTYNTDESPSTTLLSADSCKGRSDIPQGNDPASFVTITNSDKSISTYCNIYSNKSAEIQFKDNRFYVSPAPVTTPGDLNSGCVGIPYSSHGSCSDKLRCVIWNNGHNDTAHWNEQGSCR